LTDSEIPVPDDIVYLGYVEKTHGLKGGLRVRLFSGYGVGDIPVGTVILLNKSRPLTVSRCTSGGDSRVNLTFEEIGNRNDAEKCRDGSIYITIDKVDKELEFVPLYSFSGFEIHSRGCLMRIVDVEPASANPLLIVENNGSRFHVPVILAMNEGSINWEKKVIELDLPEGLEDLPL
jgi:ribosomal 30S subunit maturation factor RimM